MRIKLPDKPQVEHYATKIAEPDHALTSYLDTLLSEIERAPVEVSPKVRVKEPSPHADIKIEEQTKTELAPEPEAIKAVETQQQRLSIVPDWAENGFQVLLFKVNGITLGVPINSLMGILSYAGEATQLPGQPIWSLGVVIHRDVKVIVIDTARLLMPERLTGDEVINPQHLLLIGNGNCALAVDSISTTLTIDKDGVRWRGGGQTRPWYAGIIIQELSVLLDINGVMALLAASSKKIRLDKL
jgi:purine-binding chemotaxis protein CheW